MASACVFVCFPTSALTPIKAHRHTNTRSSLFLEKVRREESHFDGAKGEKKGQTAVG